MAKLRISSKYTILLAILTGAAIWKTGLLIAGAFPFHADEAVVGLMARHILVGERPIFFYGQAYMGSLDAFLVAGAFSIFGIAVWPIRLVQGVLALLLIWTSFILGREGWGSEKAGLISAGLLAVPTVNQLLYSTVSLGGYGEALLIGNLTMIGVLRIAKIWNGGHSGRADVWILLTGFWVGVGLWAFALSLVYALPAGIFLVWQFWRSQPADRRFGVRYAVLILTGGVVGALPWLLHASQAGFAALVGELSGSAVAVEGGSFGARAASHLFSYLFIGLPALMGLRPPWDVRWLVLPLIPLVIGIWGWIVVRAARNLWRGPRRALSLLLAGVVLTQMAAFLLTSFGVDPSGRYFLPLNVVFALYAGDVVARGGLGKWGMAAVSLLIVFQAAGTLQAAWTNPPGITTQFGAQTRVDQRALPQLIQFLEAHDEHFGYTNYWVAYPLAFESEERLIYVPALPYHLDFRYTARDDRYPDYTRQVAQASRAAYIVTGHPELEEVLRTGFLKVGVEWQEQQIGDFRVFYGLSRKISPDHLGLPNGGK